MSMNNNRAAQDVLREADRELARSAVLLSPATVARTLHVNVETVRIWIRRRKIPFIQLPSGHYRVTGETVDKILAEK
jgi:excisionase family DNA binding protein